MVRRSTWIVFGVFLLVATVAIFLVRSPSSPIADANSTPAPTAAPVLIQESLAQNEIAAIKWVGSDKVTITLLHEDDGSWSNPAVTQTIDPGIVEQLLSELNAMRILTALPAEYSLSDLGLETPAQSIVITMSDGSAFTLGIGSLTPIGNGNYVKYDSEPPVVVSKFAIDAVISIIEQTNAIPTPVFEATPLP